MWSRSRKIVKVYLESLGCRLNAAENDWLARQFAGIGWAVVAQPEDAEVIVVNTCAVTAQAGRKSRHRLRTLQRTNPAARLAVVGCWATESAEDAAALPGVTWVIDNATKPEAVALIAGQAGDPAPWEPGRWGHTRAFLGVQDGCDHTCTYCITRILRSPARSRPVREVVAEVQSLVAQGAREVILTGVSLGAYGQELPGGASLARLAQLLLQETALPRLRFSSIEPWDVDEALLRLWENPRVCRQLHLPLQAGTDALLRRMGRRHTTADFARLVARAREISPQIAITTDVMTGFPGETEAEFAASSAFVESLAFARLHVFPYSERAGTAAVRLPGSVPPAVREARAAQLRALGERLAAAYRQQFVGAVLPVLWEHRDAQGRWRGLTDNYLQVVTENEADLYNRITLARLEKGSGAQLRGVVV